MELNVQIEKTSDISRKLTIRVPKQEVATRFERGLAEVQRTAKLKGFRPGHAPLSVIKQFYGEDVRHRIFHSLIDESFDHAVRTNNLRAVGSPQIETPEHKTGDGAHDHSVQEDQDLTFTATVEIMPEIDAKGYTGLSIQQEKIVVTDADIQKIVDGLRDSQAELVPAEGGLTMADGTQSSRPVKMGDHCQLSFDGGLVTETGVVPQEGMKGSRMVEVGSGALIPGFEEQMVGMRQGETKTFKIDFPKEYHATDLAGKQAEFTITIHEVKEKKLPELNDELAKTMGYEGLEDMKTKAREFMTRERTEESERKARSELLGQLMEKNKFDVPRALVEAQTRALAQDVAQEMKRQRIADQEIQQSLQAELSHLHTRAEGQVRASLLLEGIANKEKIAVTEADLADEIKKIAAGMKVGDDQLHEYYAKNPGKKDDLEFRLRQERTVRFLFDKAKIKWIEPAAAEK